MSVHASSSCAIGYWGKTHKVASGCRALAIWGADAHAMHLLAVYADASKTYTCCCMLTCRWVADKHESSSTGCCSTLTSSWRPVTNCNNFLHMSVLTVYECRQQNESHLSVNILRFAERAFLQSPQSGLQIALADHPQQSSGEDC